MNVYLLLLIAIGIAAVVGVAATSKSLEDFFAGLLVTAIGICALATIAWGVSWGWTQAYEYVLPVDYKLEILQEQKGKLFDTKRKLERQIQILSLAREKYAGDIAKFVLEIREEKAKYRISSLNQATERMRYNLRLIQESDAYHSKLTEIQRKTESGREEMIFMDRQIDAKVQMVKVIGDGGLLEQEVSTLLDSYAAYAEKVTVNPKELKFKSLEEIWDSLPS